jgi:hypothetical protein
MICVQLNGGLGNQMFQYAAGRALAYKHQTELMLDSSQLLNLDAGPDITMRTYELNIFQLRVREAEIRDIKLTKSLLSRMINVLAFKIGFRGIQSPKYFVENKFSYNEKIEETAKDCYLSGYWQSYRYFQSIELLLREEFSFKDNLNQINSDRIKKIKNEASVSLHLRRKDFLNRKHQSIHDACSIEYYMEAVEYIANTVSTPFFFIFSDDMEWARAKLKLNYPYEFVSGNIENQSYIDMQLMSQCKHNIIANSSFSWWGAWLNSYPKKIVIAPKRWFADEKKNAQTTDLIPSSWIRL